MNVSNVASNLPDGGRGIGQLFVSTSIGVTVCSGDDADIDERIKQADMAMCRAKELGRGSDQFFSADLGAMAVARHEIVAGLRMALERGEFSRRLIWPVGESSVSRPCFAGRGRQGR